MRRVREIVSAIVLRENGEEPVESVYLRAYRAVIAAHVGGETGQGVEVVGEVSESMRAYAGTYERMLAARPVVRRGVVEFEETDRRRAMGSFYTPTGLVGHLVERALGEGEARRVCDPAVGVGGFLVGAARELCRRGGDMDSVVRENLYGVDIDPVAVELCRAVLACLTSDPAGAMRALESRIKVGNAVVGARPELIEAGVPAGAFVERPGDVREVVMHYRRRNAAERRRSGLRQTHAEDADPRLAADAWCAAFVWRRHATEEEGWDAVTQKWLEVARREPSGLPAWMRGEIERLARAFGFFHWHLEFPEVFSPRTE